MLTEKERRILAYHEGGHALMAHLMGSVMELQKVTIVSRGNALGYAFYLPEEDRYLHTKEELVDRMIVALAGRAAEEVVFGRVTNGAANDLEKVTEIARSMVFEWGMSDTVSSRTMRADNYALSETTKRMRDEEQARLTDGAYEEAVRLLRKHRAPLDRIAAALLEKETLVRDELQALVEDVEPESSASETVGVPRVVATDAGGARTSLRPSRRACEMSMAPLRRRQRHGLVPVAERDRPGLVRPCRRRAPPGTACRSRRRRACCCPRCPGSRRPAGPCRSSVPSLTSLPWFELTLPKSRAMLVSGASERNRPLVAEALSHLPWSSCATSGSGELLAERVAAADVERCRRSGRGRSPSPFDRHRALRPLAARHREVER